MPACAQRSPRSLTLAALLVAALLPGCFLAAAGAGAGGAIYVTSRGAESLVDASVNDVADAIEQTFAAEGIEVTKTETERGGDEREIQGQKGDLDVTVRFEREAPGTTKVEVTARENLAEWDKDYAKRVLQRIVERS
ncbi:MAG: DUF3568 family protein [Gemmatimonadota bacterium]